MPLHDMARVTVFGAPGSGAITLGPAVQGFQSFAAAGVQNGETLSVTITDGAKTEVGQWTYSSTGPTLTRVSTVFSTNGNAAELFSNTAVVCAAPQKSDFARFPDLMHFFEFLTASEQRNYTLRNGDDDLTSNINAWLAAIPSGGGHLYAPAGRALTQGGHTISNPFTFDGAGRNDVEGSQGITQFECVQDAVALFHVTAINGLFRNLNLAQTAGSTSSGSKAIYCTAGGADQSVNLDSVTFNGFYDQFDTENGSTWFATKSRFMNFAHWGIVVNDTVNPDAGDWKVMYNWFYGGNNSLAGIRHQASGGALIVGNKFVPNVSVMNRALDFALTGSSGQIQILNNSMDGMAEECVNALGNRYIGWVLIGNYMRTVSATASAVNLDSCVDIIFGPNDMRGNGGAGAITFSNCGGVTFGVQRQAGFGDVVVDGGGNVNVNDIFPGNCTFEAPLVVNALRDSSNTHGMGNSSIFPIVCRLYSSYGDVHQQCFLLQGNISDDGVLCKDATLDQFYIGTTNTDAGITSKGITWDKHKNVAIGSGALATNATDGFFSIPSGPGAPTGTPTSLYSGVLPMYYDSANNKLYIYNGAWRGVVLS
jgi:hypothetical protein